MTLNINPSGQVCGAAVTGVDLTQPLSEATVAEIRAAWLEHHVLAFPNQSLTDDDLERITLHFGGFGEDPFIAPDTGFYLLFGALCGMISLYFTRMMYVFEASIKKLKNETNLPHLPHLHMNCDQRSLLRPSVSSISS